MTAYVISEIISLGLPSEPAFQMTPAPMLAFPRTSYSIYRPRKSLSTVGTSYLCLNASVTDGWKGGSILQADAANTSEQRGKLVSIDDFRDAPLQVTML